MRVIKCSVWMIAIGLLLGGCSDDINKIPITADGQKLYHEIGDTFEFIGAESGLPFEVKVKKIWMEDLEKHEEYVLEHIRKPFDTHRVMFISYQVKNKGDETYKFTDDRFYPNNDVLPNLINPSNMISDIDITYPNNNLIDDMSQVTDLTLKSGEKMEITGAVIVFEQAAYDGAFVWDYDADIPQVVFTRSQSKRKDQVGVYDLGDPVYVMDQDGVEFKVTFNDIHDLKSDENVEYIDREFDSSAFLVLDMLIENSGEEEIVISTTFPSIISNGHHIFESKHFIKKGETTPIKDIFINYGESPTDGLIKPGESVEGTLYYEVRNMLTTEIMTLNAQVYYPYRGFKDYPIYKQFINYNMGLD